MPQNHISLQHFTKKQLAKYHQDGERFNIADFSQAMNQYDNLCKTISDLGATLSLLPCTEGQLGELAVIVDRLAILGRVNNHAAQTAYSTIAGVLAGNNILKFIEEHGTMDGRDVVRIEDMFLIAITERTNYDGAAQLGFYLKEAGYEVQIIDCLSGIDTHLQEHLIYMGNNTVAVSSTLSKSYSIVQYKKVILDDAENIIPNSLLINGIMIMPTGFHVQEQQLQSFGVKVMPIDMSELVKLGLSLNSLCFATSSDKENSTCVSDKMKIRA